MQWPEEGEGAGVEGTEAAEVADAEPIMAASLKTKMENPISQVHQDGPHQDMQMGLQVQPVLTIIRTAVLLTIVPTPSTAAGPTFRPIHVQNLCKIDFLGGLMPK